MSITFSSDNSIVHITNGKISYVMEILDNKYKVEIVSDKGKFKGIQKIGEKDINKVIIPKC